MKIFIFLLSALFISCSNAQKISKEQQEIDKKLNHTITELISKKTYPDGHIDLVELNDKNKDSIYNVAYRLLKENHTFKQYGLYGNVARIGLELLTKMKKYKEIDSLLEQNIFFNDFEKRTMKNTYRYLLYRKDNLKKAQSFLKETEEELQQKIKIEGTFSIKSLDEITEKDYRQIEIFNTFIQVRTMLYGKTAALKTIDSLVKVHPDLQKYKLDKDMKQLPEQILNFYGIK